MMPRVTPSWARVIATIFTVAMFYASVCTTACATGFCPDQTRQTASHDCESTPSHHSEHSHHPSSPDKRDCSAHAHPSSLFLKSDTVAQTGRTVSAHYTPAAVLAFTPGFTLTDPAIPDGTDLAPPVSPGVPLYQRPSVLRI